MPDAEHVHRIPSPGEKAVPATMTREPASAPRGKSPTIRVDGCEILRVPVRTHVVTENDDIVDVVARYAGPLVRPGDIVVVSEKVTAITQGRAIPIDRI